VSEIVFLAGADPADAANPFYANAKQFLTGGDASIPAVGPPDGAVALSLASVLAELTRRATDAGAPFDVIDLVSRPAGVGGMELPLFAADEAAGHPTRRGRLFNALLDARAGKDGALQPAGAAAVSPTTRVVLYGCDLGRDNEYLGALGELFGFPASVSAPIRVGVFPSQDGAVQHRLARTWSVLWGATSIGATADAGWPSARSTFTTKAAARFTAAQSGTDIAAAAAAATLDATASAYFYADVFWATKSALAQLLPVGTQVVNSSDDDDSTVPLTITAADMAAGSADLSDANDAVMNIAVLASVIDLPVSIADTTQYRTQTFGAGATPATGPEPSPTDDGTPPPPPGDPATTPDTLAALAAQYVAAGGTQADFDAFVADAVLAPAAPDPGTGADTDGGTGSDAGTDADTDPDAGADATASNDPPDLDDGYAPYGPFDDDEVPA
jgi:hypothetical protein